MIRQTIGIIGWYGHGNVGDEALLQSVYAQVRQQAPEASLIVLSDTPEAIQEAYGFEAARPLPLSPKSWFLRPREAMAAWTAWKRIDVLVLGGGGFFADDVSIRNVVKWSALVTVARLMGKQVMAYAIGVGPLRHPLSRILAKRIFDGMGFVSVRDSESRQWLERAGVSGPIEVTADPALVLDPGPTNVEGLLESLGVPLDRPLVAFCIPPFYHDPVRWPDQADRLEQFRQAWVQAIEWVVEQGASPIFVPMQHAPAGYTLFSDLDFADELIARSPVAQRVFVLRKALPPTVVKAALARMDMVVGMRLHAIILAAGAHVPVTGVIYHHKSRSLVARMGVSEFFVEVDNLTADTLLPALRQAWANRYQIRETLATLMPSLQAEARRNEVLFASALGGQK